MLKMGIEWFFMHFCRFTHPSSDFLGGNFSYSLQNFLTERRYANSHVSRRSTLPLSFLPDSNT